MMATDEQFLQARVFSQYAGHFESYIRAFYISYVF